MLLYYKYLLRRSFSRNRLGLRRSRGGHGRPPWKGTGTDATWARIDVQLESASSTNATRPRVLHSLPSFHRVNTLSTATPHRSPPLAFEGHPCDSGSLAE